MSTNLFDETNEDSDEDIEDDDYKPENEVLSDKSEDESEEEDNDITNGKKRQSKSKKTDGTTEEDSSDTKSDQKLSETELKQKSDSLWEEFRKDVPKSEQTIESNESEVSTSISKTFVTKTYDFAGEEVKVTEELANTSKAKTDSNESNDTNDDKPKEAPFRPIKRTGGLGSVLSQLKKPKMSTLQKTALDWKDYKKSEGIEDELKLHTKSKDTFVERQAFLQRTDVRQFELEKRIREKNRSQRQLSKD